MSLNSSTYRGVHFFLFANEKAIGYIIQQWGVSRQCNGWTAVDAVADAKKYIEDRLYAENCSFCAVA